MAVSVLSSFVIFARKVRAGGFTLIASMLSCCHVAVSVLSRFVIFVREVRAGGFTLIASMLSCGCKCPF